MNRYISRNRTTKRPIGSANVIAVLTLIAILSALLLFFTGERQSQHVFQSYCGDFGLYGKLLVLMEDSTFRFSYHGCSLTQGRSVGKWRVKDESIYCFSTEDSNVLLDAEYQIRDKELVPLNRSAEGKLVLCE